MSDWWARKLSGTPQQPLPPTQAQYPATQPTWPAQQPTWPAQQPTYPATHTQLEAPQTPSPAKATHLLSEGTCPSCASGNYMKIHGGYRCFECGYPLVQSTSGISGIGNNSGPSQPAQQVSTANNYQPMHIIGKA